LQLIRELIPKFIWNVNGRKQSWKRKNKLGVLQVLKSGSGYQS
jgi:hypothetical protein